MIFRISFLSGVKMVQTLYGISGASGKTLFEAGYFNFTTIKMTFTEANQMKNCVQEISFTLQISLEDFSKSFRFPL